jgi:hypothetical protein
MDETANKVRKVAFPIAVILGIWALFKGQGGSGGAGGGAPGTGGSGGGKFIGPMRLPPIHPPGGEVQPTVQIGGPGDLSALNPQPPAVTQGPGYVAGVAIDPRTGAPYQGQTTSFVTFPLQLPVFVNPATGERIGGGVITTPEQFKATFGTLPPTPGPTIIEYEAFNGTGASATFPSMAAAQAWVQANRKPGTVWAIYANYSDGSRKNVGQGVG